MRKIDISVVVAFRDAAWCMERCLEGLTRERVPGCRIEIVAVDNGSRDASARIATRFAGVRLFEETRTGVYIARNRALAVARGRVIVFTDPDCVPEPGWLARLTEPLFSSDAMIALGHTTFTGQSLILRTLQDYESTRDSVIFNTGDPVFLYGRANNMAVHRRVFEELGWFETLRRGGDSVLVRRCADAYGCASIRYLPNARVEHLEIHDARSYYKKVFTYGRSMRRFAQLIPTQAPNRTVRRLIFERSCDEHGYHALRQALLGLLLLLESATWMLGWRMALGGRDRLARSPS